MIEKTSKQIKYVHETNTHALKTAIANLEQFSKKNESSPIVHVADLTVHDGTVVDASDSPVQKTTFFTRYFLNALLSSKTRTKYHQKKIEVQEAVLASIDVIKRNHLFIEKLKAGTPEEQKLAENTLEAITRYNAVLEKSDKTPEDWGKRLSHFFSEYAGLAVDENIKTNRIDLPRSQPLASVIHKNPNIEKDVRVSLAFRYNVATEQPSEEQHGFTAVQLTDVAADPLSQKEADLLRMKAHTLLRAHGVRYKSMADMLQEIKHAPIATHSNPDGSAHMTLKLTLLPGTIANVHGDFTRNTNAQSSHPVPDSFRLMLQTSQTAFPFPMQYTGWSCGDALLPPYPLRLDQMPLFNEFYTRKQNAVMLLQPGMHHFDNARQLWKLKKQAFSNEMIELHQQLNRAIMRAAVGYSAITTEELAITEYFGKVQQHPCPADYLAAAYQTINESIISRPFALLQEIWMGCQDTDPKTARKEIMEALKADWNKVSEMLSSEIESTDGFEKAALKYILFMGGLLQGHTQALMMQHFSETIRCAPPLLSDFEQKLQGAALRQVSSYLDELEDPFFHYLTNNPQAIEGRMRDLILADIALFQADAFDNLEIPEKPFVDELELYFNTRYSEAVKKEK